MTTDSTLIVLQETLQNAENAVMEAAQQWAAVPGTDGVIRHRLAFAAAQLLTAATEPGKVTRSYASEKLNRATADLTTVADMLHATEHVTFHPDHAQRRALDTYNQIMNDVGGVAYRQLTDHIQDWWTEAEATRIGIAVSNAAMGACGHPAYRVAVIQAFSCIARLSALNRKDAKLNVFTLAANYLDLFEED